MIALDSISKVIYNFVLSSGCIFYHTFSVLAVETISTILEVRRTRNDFPPTSSSLSIWTVHLKILFLWIITSSIHILFCSQLIEKWQILPMEKGEDMPYLPGILM